MTAGRRRGARLAKIVSVLGAAALLAGCATTANRGYVYAPKAPLATAEAPEPAPAPEPVTPGWKSHFRTVSQGAILISLDDRRLSYWSPGGTEYREFPIAVPRSPDLEKRGRTSVVRRRKNPDWRPTPDMLRRNPALEPYIGPGPHNPLGERALYLGWRYYAIHGTNNPGSIGSRATSGCFRMFPEHIEWLYEQARLGTPVRVVDSVPEVADRSLSLRALNDPTALADLPYREPLARAPRKRISTLATRQNPVRIPASSRRHRQYVAPQGGTVRWVETR